VSHRWQDDVAEAVRQPQTRVLSVDCFDTLLLRKVPKPADVHLLVGTRLANAGLILPHITPQGFAKLRRLAEEEARRRKRADSLTTEVTLEEIYRVLIPGVWRDETNVEPWTTEVATESECLFVDYGVSSFIGSVLEESPHTLVVASDSYFNEAQLRLFLNTPSLKSLKFDHVFASSDLLTGKSDRLWPEIAQRLGVVTDEIVHFGDNEEADVVCARRHGIRAIHSPPSTSRFWEVHVREGIVGREDYPSKWCDPILGDGGITALRRRATWLDPPADLDQDDQVAWETGTSIFGPVFTGFAPWLLEQSEAVGAERLLFLMREGQLLREFAERAPHPASWQPTLRTAWISREACARASIFEGSASELLSFLDRLRPPPPSHLVASFGLELADIPNVHSMEREFEQSDQRDVLAHAFVDRILADATLLEKVVQRSAVKRERLMRYIRQVAGTGKGPVGLVDVGWSGSIQESLHNMFQRDADPLAFHGLYLLAHVGSSDRALRGVRLQGYLGTLGTDPFDVAAITGGAEIVELVSTCAEGSLLEIGRDLEPVLAPPAGGPREQRSRGLVQEGAKAYQTVWLEHHQNGDSIFETTPYGVALLSRILKRFVSQPNHDEARAFNWWLHEENYGSEGTEQLVPPRYVPTIRHRSAEDLHWAPMSDLHWTGGAAALVDHELSDAIFLMREGTVDPGRFSSPTEGLCRLAIRQGAGELDGNTRPVVRNRHGLSHLEWRLRVDDAMAVQVQFPSDFVLFRPDVIEVIDVAAGETTLFRWLRGDAHAALPASGIRWLTVHVMALNGSSDITVPLAVPVTTREMRVTVAGAFFPTAEVADGHLQQDPEAEVAALRQEIDAIYATKLFRAANLPRRIYGTLRWRRNANPPA
jgi:FMN phosphatase YigB (HAD superfamily)